MKSFLWYFLAAVAEIGGCFTFWAWLRLGKSPAWTIPGFFLLIFFAMVLTRIDTAWAGRAYAAYGGVYIVASLLWMWLIERKSPDHWDSLGTALCLVGAAVVLWGPRGQ
jgi:small multidrug resistance family-3 protein